MKLLGEKPHNSERPYYHQPKASVPVAGKNTTFTKASTAVKKSNMQKQPVSVTNNLKLYMLGTFNQLAIYFAFQIIIWYHSNMDLVHNYTKLLLTKPGDVPIQLSFLWSKQWAYKRSRLSTTKV